MYYVLILSNVKNYLTSTTIDDGEPAATHEDSGTTTGEECRFGEGDRAEAGSEETATACHRSWQKAQIYPG